MIGRLALSLAFCASALGAQPSAVATLKPGQVRIITSYLNTTGRLVADTMVVNVLPVPVATVRLFNQINPPRWVSDIVVGKTFCAYAQARDDAGNVVTGRKVTMVSTDTLIARVAVSAVCPDTTVDMTKLQTLPAPPSSLVRR